MKFTCEKALLLSALNTAARAVSPKSAIPALEGILIEADEHLQLTGYNLEIGISTSVPADITEKGTLVLPATLFCNLVRKLDDDVILFEANGCAIHIQCGMADFHLTGSDPEEFPELPSVDGLNTVTLPQGTLRAMISQTIFAVSDNESRPIHTGSLFEVDDNSLTVVSVDGYRLALRHEPITEKSGPTDFSFVVPRAALSEVEKICSDSDESVSITQGNRHVMFRFGDTILISRRLEGEFLAYRNAIPKTSSVTVYGETRALLASIDRVSYIITDKLKSPLRCFFDDQSLTITTKTALGQGKDVCPIQGDGKGLEIGFNHKYLMEALKAAPADQVCLGLTTGVAPCVILPADDSGKFLYMVLPVRRKAGT